MGGKKGPSQVGRHVAQGAHTHLGEHVCDGRVGSEAHGEGGEEEADVVGATRRLRRAPPVPERGPQADADARATLDGANLRRWGRGTVQEQSRYGPPVRAGPGIQRRDALAA